MTQPAGWYQALGDPEGTHRYWDGEQWTTGPQPMDTAPLPPPPQPGAGYATASTTPPPTASNPFGWWLLGWKQMLNTGGRARRKEFGWFTLINLIGFGIIANTLFGAGEGNGSGWITLAVLASIPTGIRRLHDIGSRGQWMLLLLVPALNALLLLFLALAGGDDGPNEYGPSPKFHPEPDPNVAH